MYHSGGKPINLSSLNASEKKKKKEKRKKKKTVATLAT